MNLIANLTLCFTCFIPVACGGIADETLSHPGATTSVGGSSTIESSSETGGATTDSTTTLPTTGGSSAVSTSSATGGNTAEKTTNTTDESSISTTGGSSTINATGGNTFSTGGSSAAIATGGTSATTGGTTTTGGYSTGGTTYSESPSIPVGPSTYCADHMPFSYVDLTTHQMYFFGQTLSFSLNPASPKGAIGDGLQKVIIINAWARCGDVELKHVEFQTTSVSDDVSWMAAVANAESVITYERDGVTTFASYGPESSLQPKSSVTSLTWSHDFSPPILIKKDQTFVFSLSVTFGRTVTPSGTFSFRLYPRYSWDDPDDPNGYPAMFENVTGVNGNELSYTPST